jgi:deoxyribodipyrimidine photo-lyase
MTQAVSIYWFRQDLRLTDNPALTAAVKHGDVLPIYILDDQNAEPFSLGGASRWWLHQSLKALNDSLDGKLLFYKGDPRKILTTLCQQYSATHVFWNRCYEPWRIIRDKTIKKQLLDNDIDVTSFNASLSNEPWEIYKKDGTPYKIFTPYYRQTLLREQSSAPLAKPNISFASTDQSSNTTIESLELLPRIKWYDTVEANWQPGEKGASQLLQEFVSDNINHYKKGRDFPAINSVSKLSPHLHFGEISPRQILHKLTTVAIDDNSEHFKRQLIWREFSYYLLFHSPSLPSKNLKTNFDHFPWENNRQWLKQWQQGQTGYPIIDAGMRELWQTGTMHNRVRMITASFLIKNLLVDWRLGAQWFWDCLLDADLANNSASWQWVAGCGTDASPYFRIFNPITQGEKFDPDGEYIKQFLPELSQLPKKYLSKPWQAPSDILAQADIILGVNYPNPIVDIKVSRQKALDAFKTLKEKNPLNDDNQSPQVYLK